MDDRVKVQALAETVKRGLSGRRLDDAAIIVSAVDSEMRRFTDNSITISKGWHHFNVTLYLVKEGKAFGFESSNIAEDGIKRMLKEALNLAPHTPAPDVEPELEHGPHLIGRFTSAFDPGILNLRDRSVDLIEEALNAASGEGAMRSSGTLIYGRRERVIKTLTGCEGSESSTFLEFSIRSFCGEESTGNGVWCGSSLRGFDPAEVGREAGVKAYEAQDPVEGAPGVYNVVFEPPAMAALLETVASSSSAYMAEIGLSYLKGKVGKRIAARCLDLSDDPRNPTSPMVSYFDDEGRETHPVRIVQSGILKSLLHTSKTAKRFAVNPTGSAYFSPSVGDMVPSATAITVEKGKSSKEELLEMVDEGLLIRNLWYTRFQNYLTGDFSSVPRDGILRIKDGRVYGAVKGLRIGDNMLRILSSIKGLGDERAWIKWWEVDTPILAPPCLVEDVRLTKSTK